MYIPRARQVFLAIPFSFIVVSAAQAQDTALTLKASTLGIGVELSTSLTETINLRGGVHYFKLSKTLEKSGNSYDFDLKLNSYTALIDWHVFNNGFRLSGGALFDRNKLDGVAQAANSYSIGNDTYTSAEVGALTGKVDFRDVSPYLGLGWGNAVNEDSNWSFTVDIGVIFTGGPRVDLQSTGGTLSDDPTFLTEIAREEDNVRDDLDFFKYYPVAALGVSYRF